MNLLGLAIIYIPMPTNVALAIVLMGLAYTILSITVQRRLSSPKKMRELQAKINVLTTEINEMTKRKEDTTAKQQEIMPLMGQTMKMQLKSTAVLIPTFFIVYYGLLPLLFFSFASTNLDFIFELTYQNVFFATVFILGIVLSLVLLQIDKMKLKKEKQNTTNQQIQSSQNS